MADSDRSFWYRVGYAMERARRVPATAERLAGLAERESEGSEPPERRGAPAWPTADELIATGVRTIVAELLGVWRPRGRTRFSGLLRAGAAGGAAALLLDVLRPLVDRRTDARAASRGLGDRVIVGVGQGLLYGAVVEPRVPGPPVLKGALYGSAEYAADPAGGLARLLGSHAPQARVPLVGDFLDGVDPHDRVYLEHVVFGIALALLYGSSPSSSGTVRDETEE